MNRWSRLRWHVRLLAVIDCLLGTHLVDRAIRRWQQELRTLQSEIISVQTRLEELLASQNAVLRQVCLNYLQWRQYQSPDDWLHFDPRIPDQKAAIDVLTRALVSPHWACWRINQVTTGTDSLYTYDLVPDWQALHQDALRQADNFPSSLLEWLQEQQWTSLS
ncbi:MAG: hypothetical protein Kow0063_12530 [Anaerolineae bacterium]